MSNAIEDIRGHKTIAVDAEGLNLGREGGRMTLLQIATPVKTYIFDVEVSCSL